MFIVPILYVEFFDAQWVICTTLKAIVKSVRALEIEQPEAVDNLEIWKTYAKLPLGCHGNMQG